MRDNFPPSTKQKLAERAGYICSNPSCNHITIGPVENDHTKSTKIGKASHICAASPGGPRYDMSQSEKERTDISNGIWLCASCADLIDKNNGIDYPAEHLRKWKKDHEALMKKCLEGNKRIIFQFMDISKDRNVARNLVKYLENKGALFVPYSQENMHYVIESVKEIRNYIAHGQLQVEEGSELGIIFDSMNNALRHFMNTTSVDIGYKEIEYSLGALRKAMGINLGIIVKDFKIDISTDLGNSIPR
jgi:hypothetical protein